MAIVAFPRMIGVALVFATALVAAEENQQLEESLKEKIKKLYSVMQADDEQAQLNMLQSLRPMKEDLVAMKTPNAEEMFELVEKSWPYYKEHVKDLAKELRPMGKIGSIEVKKDEDPEVGKDVPQYSAYIRAADGGRSSRTQGYVYINEKWLFPRIWISPENEKAVQELFGKK